MLKYFDELFSTINPTDEDMDYPLEGIIERVSNAMNMVLNAEPTAEEVVGALKEMHPTKGPGPDGLHAIFYKKCWEIVGLNAISFVKKAWNGEVDLKWVNETNIVLIPKVKGPKRLSQYRPISAMCYTRSYLIRLRIVSSDSYHTLFQNNRALLYRKG